MTCMKYSEREYIYRAGYPAEQGLPDLLVYRESRAGRAATLLRPDDL